MVDAGHEKRRGLELTCLTTTSPRKGLSVSHFPYIKLWVNDYLADTYHLNPEEHGTYLLLLIAAWKTEGNGLPDDDKILARYAGTTLRRWRKLAPRIRPFFTEEDGKLYQPRLSKEARNATKFSNSQGERRRGKPLKKKKTTITGDQPARARSHSSVRKKETSVSSFSYSPSDNPNGSSTGETPKARMPEIPKFLDKRKPPDDCAEAVEAWNLLAEQHGLARVVKLTESRKRKLRARLKDAGGIEGWRLALAKIPRSEFLLGKNDRGWKAGFDFVLQESSFTKLMEETYTGGPRDTEEEAKARVDAMLTKAMEEADRRTAEGKLERMH